MARNDLIIVIPGITGSTLTRDGADVWSSRPAAVLATLATLGRRVRDLRLPDDIGDEAPQDGVEAAALMPHLHFLPGLWTPIHGYGKLVERIRRVCAPSSGQAKSHAAQLNPVLFPYDWRLSNRLTARRLKQVAEGALERWRDLAAENRDAKIVFVCHSMGGLIARWYISKEGGAQLTRKMITLGTPYRGAVKALSVLTDGPMPRLGCFGTQLHATVLSFPSVQQLLPSYACIEQDNGSFGYLSDQADSAVSRAARRDAANFYRDLEEAESNDTETAARRHAVVGTFQPTNASVSFRGGRYHPSQLLGGNDLAGDGTVSVASVPKGVALDSNSFRRVADKHGHLQCNDSALDEVESVITSDPIVVKGGSFDDLSVTLPEVLSLGESAVATIESAAVRRGIAITLRDENGGVVSSVEKVMRSSTFEYKVTSLDPGAYSLQVQDVASGSSNAGVCSSFLVWPGMP